MAQKELPKSILEGIKNGASAFQEILSGSGYSYHKIDLDCGALPKPSKTNLFAPESLNSIFFSKLPDNSRPCLYYFEILEGSNEEILKRFGKFKSNQPQRRTSALKNNPPVHTNVLYVGKVKRGIGGRMVVHFGYYHVEATAGLQLSHWTPGMSLRLRLHIFSFENSAMADMVGSLELSFARELDPLIGKH